MEEQEGLGSMLVCDTSDLRKYGLKNLMIGAPNEDYAETCMKILNDIAWDMIQGEVFESDKLHTISYTNEDGKDVLQHVFWAYDMVDTDNDNEEQICIRYLFFKRFHWNRDGKDYVFDADKCEWVAVDDLVKAYFG